jgi:Rrf2 family protein
MFNISTKGKYGLLAVFELSKFYNKNSVQIKYISEKHNIPQNYLEQILVILKKKGFIKSFRGKNGGYSLNISPNKIIAYDVLECLEGELNFLQNNSKTELDFFWNSLQEKLKKYLNLSFEDLLLKFQEQNQTLMFNI